jgi:hypothetical protein
MIDISKLQNVHHQGDRIIAACPACNEEGRDLKNRNHLSILKDGRFNCVVDDSKAHRQRIWGLAGDGSGNAEFAVIQPQEPPVEIDRVWDSSILDRLIKDYSYWNGRGISTETVEPFKGGIAVGDGQMKGRWVFPIFNSDDKIIGFNGRRLDGKPEMKWKIIGKSSKFVWGGLDEIVDAERVILVESIGDSLALREHGFPENLCLFGTNLSQSVLAHLIAVNPKEIIISTNTDSHGVGQKSAGKIQNILSKFFKEDIIGIRLPSEPGKKDWNEVTPEHIKETFKTGF